MTNVTLKKDNSLWLFLGNIPIFTEGTFVEFFSKLRPMRLNIFLFLTFFSATVLWGQIEIKEQKFDREKLEFQIFLLNTGQKTLEIRAIGVASTYTTLDVCDEVEKKTKLPDSHVVDFEVDRPETIRNLLRPVLLKPGEDKGILIRANPLPEAICDYWEVDIRGILGFSNMDKWYSQPVTITEDDYYNFNDRLDHLEENPGQKLDFKASHLSRLQLSEWIQKGEKKNLLKALNNFNEFFWPTDQRKVLLAPLLLHEDSIVRQNARLALEKQNEKLAQAIQTLAAQKEGMPSQKKAAIQGLGLAQHEVAIPAILDFLEKDKSMEPHLIARTLMQIDNKAMLPRLAELAAMFKQEAAQKRGFSHDRWKWLTAAALLANYGYAEALPLLKDCMRSVLDNYEYPELRLILEALGRSTNDDLKKALASFYEEAMDVQFSEDFTIAILPLYLQYSDLDKNKKEAILGSFLDSTDKRLRHMSIHLVGQHQLEKLYPKLEQLLLNSTDWEEQYLLNKSLKP